MYRIVTRCILRKTSISLLFDKSTTKENMSFSIFQQLNLLIIHIQFEKLSGKLVHVMKVSF